MKYQTLILYAVCFSLAACGKSEAPVAVDTATDPVPTLERENPLLTDWNTPFGVPPFDLIESSDYLPALREALECNETTVLDVITDPMAYPPVTFFDGLDDIRESKEES